MAVAKASKKQTPVVVTINRRWQLTFIGVLVVAQAISTAMTLWTLSHFGHISGGTWTFQITTWGYPLLYAAAGYVFVRRRARGFVPRMFWALFVTMLGIVAYNALQAIVNYLYAEFNWWSTVATSDPSLWDAFGTYWTQMIIGFVLYCAALWGITVKGKRA
jgi:hypothetical protein